MNVKFCGVEYRGLVVRSVVVYPQESCHQGHAFLSYQGDDKEGVIDVSTRAVVLSFGLSHIGLVIKVSIDNLHLFAFVVLVNILKTLDEGGFNHVNQKVSLHFNNHGVKGENTYWLIFFLLLLLGEERSWRWENGFLFCCF